MTHHDFHQARTQFDAAEEWQAHRPSNRAVGFFFSGLNLHGRRFG